MSNQYKTIINDGLWNNNIVFAQMLALCPLLAVTGSATNGLGMGLATTFVLVTSNLIISLARGLVTPEVRIPIFVLLIASIVTFVDMYMNAYLHELYKMLGLFIPLIVTNCAILGRAESFASRQPIGASVLDGLMMGIGFIWALVIVGATREILGSGTLFSNASLLLGKHFSFLEMTLIPDYRGFLLMILPPGAFIALGFLLAGKRIIDKRLAARKLAAEQKQLDEAAASASAG
jgi:electron transport complex protein RnfE